MTLKEAWKDQWRRTLKHKVHQELQVNKIKELLKIKPKVFLDIGPGNLNSEAWQIYRHYPDCKILGFEPQTERYKLLKKHNYPGTLLPLAIGNTDKVVEAYMGFPDGGKSDFQLHPSRDSDAGGYKKVKIKTSTIDTLNNTFGPFEDVFIWADVEGAELKILLGAKELFKNNKVIGVLVELRNTPMGEGACTAAEVNEFLVNQGFAATEDVTSLTSGHKDFIFIPEI